MFFFLILEAVSTHLNKFNPIKCMYRVSQNKHFEEFSEAAQVKFIDLLLGS